MQIEVRPPTRDEMSSYYRALPYASELPQWEPAPAAWHGGPEPWPPQRPRPSDEQLEIWADRDIQDGNFHPIAAFADGKVVGGSAMLSFEVTVPGRRQVPMGGMTSTGVIPTYRRRGLLRRMMQSMFDAALERGEPLAMLSASEGGIYGRYGFSPATWRTRWEIARHEAELRPAPDDTGSLELVDASTARAVWPEIHDTVRRTRVGELSSQPGQWDGLTDESSGTDGPRRYLIHLNDNGGVDGIADFRLPWSGTELHAGTLVVEAIEATTPAAYRALWTLLLDFDLTKRIVAAGRPRDEPLRWMLANPRAMRVTRQSDNLWMRILDLPTAVTSRRYAVPGDIIFTVAADTMCPGNIGTWQLDATNNTCVRTDEAAELDLDVQALGSLYLGGVSVHHLAQAGLIRSDSPDALARLARILRTDPEPHNSFGF